MLEKAVWDKTVGGPRIRVSVVSRFTIRASRTRKVTVYAWQRRSRTYILKTKNVTFSVDIFKNTAKVISDKISK